MTNTATMTATPTTPTTTPSVSNVIGEGASPIARRLPATIDTHAIVAAIGVIAGMLTPVIIAATNDLARTVFHKSLGQSESILVGTIAAFVLASVVVALARVLGITPLQAEQATEFLASEVVQLAPLAAQAFQVQELHHHYTVSAPPALTSATSATSAPASTSAPAVSPALTPGETAAKETTNGNSTEAATDALA